MAIISYVSNNLLSIVHNIYLLGLFYYFLGNIKPQLRSVLRCTQLVACVTTTNLEKYGFDKVLQPFIGCSLS